MLRGYQKRAVPTEKLHKMGTKAGAGLPFQKKSGKPVWLLRRFQKKIPKIDIYVLTPDVSIVIIKLI